MADAFLTAALCHIPLLAAVIGRVPDLQDAILRDHDVYWSEDNPAGWLQTAAGATAAGRLARGLSDADLARLDFHNAVHGLFPQSGSVTVQDHAVQVRIWYPDLPRSGSPWSASGGPDPWADILASLAGDVMALFGQRSSSDLRARIHPMLVRAASRVRATPAPCTLRRRASPGDVVVDAFRQPYADFFAVEEYDLRFRKFDAGTSPTVTRAIFVSGDAVTVLPYDPVRDRVLLIEQFRVVPLARGDDQPWMLEVIAGRIDPGETPEQSVRREAEEEAGLTLGPLLKVAAYYPSPGAKAEFLYSYVALADLPDGTAGTFGLAAEAENIRGHLISFDDLMGLVESGEAANAPLVLSALWLARERSRLRG